MANQQPARVADGQRGRLEGWKEIAAHVERSVRTVRRWERDEGLPVHRHMHGQKGTPYAFVDEIDRWRARRHVAPLVASPAASTESSDKAPEPANDVSGTDRHVLRLIVLPFQNIGGDSPQEYFAEGLTEEVISYLGHLDARRLRVIGRTTSMYYKREHTVKEIQHELGVQYLLEGSVRREDGKLRVMARLVNAADQSQVWTEHYDFSFATIFYLQEKVAELIGMALAFQLRLPVPAKASMRTENTAAHDAYLRGLKSLGEWNESGVMRGIGLFRRAIEEDPLFPPPYADLALAYNATAFFFSLASTEALFLAQNAAETAVGLSPLISKAWTQVAWSHLLQYWDGKAGERACRRAIRMNPSDATAHVILAACLVATGKLNRALNEVGQALSLDPMSKEVAAVIAMGQPLASRYSKAIEVCEKNLERSPDFALLHNLLATIYTQRGEYKKAQYHVEKSIALLGEEPELLVNQCFILARSRRHGEAVKVSQRVKALAAHKYVRAYSLALCSSALGRSHEALQNLRDAFEQKEPQIVFLKYDTRFRFLWRSPDFKTLAKQVAQVSSSIKKRSLAFPLRNPSAA